MLSTLLQIFRFTPPSYGWASFNQLNWWKTWMGQPHPVRGSASCLIALSWGIDFPAFRHKLTHRLFLGWELLALRLELRPPACWRRSLKGRDRQVTWELRLEAHRSLPLSVECTFCPLFPQWAPFSRTQPWVKRCWDQMDWTRDWTLLRPLYKCKTLMGLSRGHPRQAL